MGGDAQVSGRKKIGEFKVNGKSMKEKIQRPPKIAAWILKHTAATTEEASLLGDLEEEYRIRSQKYTPLKTKLWYWSQVLASIPPFVKTSLYWSTEMIKNYLKIAWRNIQKHGVFSFINITGLAIVLLTAIIAGSYPAIYLSAFRPVAAMKGLKESKSKGASFRKMLVVVQFSLAIMLIFGTTVVSKQLHFIQKAKLGFDKENIVQIPIKENIGKKYQSVKNELLKNPNILSVSAQRYPFSETTWRSSGVFDWEGKDPERRIDLVFAGVDYDFFETLKLEIKEGRPFSKDVLSDEEGGYILNESAIKEIGLDSPVGKRFAIQKNEGTIIGVAKDAHFRSFHHEIEPRVFYIVDMTHATDAGLVMIKIHGAKIPEALSHIERVWKDINPVSPFEYHFLDQTYDRLYRSEKRIGTVFNSFTMLAIFISCLGLFGLASFMAEQRTKEIGIRKVLGASAPEIILLLTKEFTKWVLVANLIAWPVAYLVMNKLLQTYAYRTAIGIDIFIFSGLIALTIALLTVSYQALRAARSNPADSLRYE